MHAGRGDVMRAVDVRDGSRVIVKQSRALVDEGEDGVDTRLRVRNERRVLAVLEGVDGVAGYVDHFRAGTDEFLVTRDVGRRNLAEDVTEYGRYAAAGSAGAVPGRTLEQLAQQMATVILAVHERGVLIRDLNPRNVVVAPDGSAKLIDLGLAGHNGLYLPGGTSGYSSARQFRHQEPTTGDDLVALGTTLCFAWSALPAVVLSTDVDEPRRMALRMIRARCGDAPGGVMGMIGDLLGMDDARVHKAARRMAAGGFSAGRRTRTAIPAPAPVTDLLIDGIAGNLLNDLTGQTRKVLTEVPRTEQVGVDGCVYRGGAGIGLELLEHLEIPGVPALVAELVPFSRRGADVVRLGPGLWTGRTGLDVFRLSAAQRLAPGAVSAADADPYSVETLDADWKPEYSDLISGASGIGLGHLLLHDLDGRPDHLDIARQCAEYVLANAIPGPRSQPGLAAVGDAGVEVSAARGHGLAGTVDALAVIGARLGDDTILAGADERARDLVRRADRLVAKSPPAHDSAAGRVLVPGPGRDRGQPADGRAAAEPARIHRGRATGRRRLYRPHPAHGQADAVLRPGRDRQHARRPGLPGRGGAVLGRDAHRRGPAARAQRGAGRPSGVRAGRPRGVQRVVGVRRRRDPELLPTAVARRRADGAGGQLVAVLRA